jgi:hypothetical protein
MNFFLLTIFLTFSFNVAGQKKATKNLKVLALPAVSFAPETKWLFGAGAVSTFKLHPKQDIYERPSSLNIGLAFTQNKQVIFSTQFQLFNKNKDYFYGEIGYFKFSYFFYGVGKQQVQEELYKVNFPRIRLNSTHRINSLLWLGGGYHFENYDIVETVPNGALSTQVFNGAEGSRVSGLGAIAILDSRDSIFFPNKGVFANFNLFQYGRYIGGNKNFTKLVADVAAYKKIGKGVNLAGQWFNSFSRGDIPFQSLSLLGGTKLMRGYYQGRFMDNNASLLQSEARIKLYKRISTVLFASTAVLGNEKDFLRFNDPKFAYGAGIRFTFNRKEHLNVRLDYAKGKEKGFFYVTIGEAF